MKIKITEDHILLAIFVVGMIIVILLTGGFSDLSYRESSKAGYKAGYSDGFTNGVMTYQIMEREQSYEGFNTSDT